MRGRVVGKTHGLNLRLLRGLQQIADAAGITISVTSGYRSIAEQEVLYQRYLAGTGNLAAKPGTSFHNFRGAADTAPRLRDSYGSEARAAGLSFPVASEAWHVQVGGMSKEQAASERYYRGGSLSDGPDRRTTKVVQRQLFELGFCPDDLDTQRWVDGVWGSRTADALKACQRAYSTSSGRSIAVDGRWGPQSAAAIAWLYAHQKTEDPRKPDILRYVESAPVRGQRVTRWQARINELVGREVLSVDGVFGSRTRDATLLAQRQLGVGADGIVGARTLNAMKRALRDRALAPDEEAASAPSAHGRPRYYVEADTTAAVARSDGGSILGGPFKIVLHTTEAKTYRPSAADYYGHQHYPHLTLARVDGRWRFFQHIPFDRAAKSLRNAPTGVQTNRDAALQVEIAWTAAEMDALPRAALVVLRRWIQWCADEFGVQLQAPEFAGPEAYGASGTVRMSPSEWDAFDGVCAHQHVPENDHWDCGLIDIDFLLRPADADERVLAERSRQTRARRTPA
ncbi:MAG: peptidoglycan-binding protein [Egibacteraceae bacterium]